MKIDNSVDYSFNRNVAKTYGLHGAMILNRIVWSVNMHIERDDQQYFIDGEWWMYDTYESIANHFDGLIAKTTIRDKIQKFEKDNLLISRQVQKSNYNRTKWYSINVKVWKLLVFGSDVSNGSNSSHRNDISTSFDGSQVMEVSNVHEGKLPTSIDGRSHVVSSLLNSHLNSHTKYIYPESHPMSAIFDNLRMVSIVKSKFNLADYEKWLTKHMETKSLSIEELTEASHEWQEYHNDRTEKPKSPKGSFNTWLKNFLERRNKQQKQGQGRNLGWKRPITQLDLDYKKWNPDRTS